MRQDKQPWLNPVCKLSELSRTSMALAPVGLPFRCDLFVSCLRIGFVNQDIAIMAIVEQGLSGCCVAGKDNGSVGRLDTKAEGVLKSCVPCAKRADLNVAILVENARIDLVCFDLAARGRKGVDAIDAVFNVDLPRAQHVSGHFAEAFGTVDIDWVLSSQNPRRQN